MDDPASTPTGSRFALGVLVVLVVLSPWPFGSVHPFTRWLITVVCLLTATGIALVRLRRREGVEIPTAAALAAAVFLLGLMQLIPLPPGLHAFLAPGSAAIWHPGLPAAARILGDGPRPVSIWPEATRGALGLGLGVIALATLAMPALRNRRQAAQAASVVVGSGLAVAVYSLFARLLFGDKLFGVLAVPTVAPFGPFVSKNHFAGYVEMAALLALGLAVGLADGAGRKSGFLGWVGSRRAPRVVIAYCAAAILSLAVLMSLSRGGAVSLAFGLTVLILFRSGRVRGVGRWRVRGLFVPAVLTVAVAVLLVVPPEARERLRSIGAGKRDRSTAFRAGVWGDTLRLAATSPFVGYGLGTFSDALPRFKTGAADVLVEHAENDYLELLAEGGVVDLTLGLGVVFALCWLRPRRSAEAHEHLPRGLTLGSFAALAALAVHSLLDFNLRIPSNALLCVLLAAIVQAARPPFQARRLGAPGFAALSALVVLLVASPPHSNRVETLPPVRSIRAGSASTPLRLRALGDEVKRHLNRRPGDAIAWVWLGWSRAEAGPRREGAAIAAYGASLDPQRRSLSEFAERLWH